MANVSSSPPSHTTGKTGVSPSTSHFQFYVYASAVNAAHAYDPSLPAGNTSYDPATAAFPVKYDTSKSDRILEIKYRTIKECTADTLKQFKEKGWIA